MAHLAEAVAGERERVEAPGCEAEGAFPGGAVAHLAGLVVVHPEVDLVVSMSRRV